MTLGAGHDGWGRECRRGDRLGGRYYAKHPRESAGICFYLQRRGWHQAWTRIIHSTPKRSTTMPNRGEKKVLASGIRT